MKLDLRGAALVFLMLLFTYMYFVHDPGWNGNTRLGLTFAIVQEGRLTIDSFHEASGTETGDKAFFNGHYYTDKAIGTSLAAVFYYLPLYWFSKLAHVTLGIKFVRYFLTFFVIGVPSALSGSLLYLLSKHVSGSRVWAFTVTAAILLGTMCMPYSMLFYGHQLAASLLFMAFFLLFWIKKADHPPRALFLFLVGFLLGLALITEYTSLVIVVPLIGYYFSIVRPRRPSRSMSSIIIPALGGLIPLCGLLIYNHLCFGDPLSFGYSFEASENFSTSMNQGLMGIGWPRLDVLFYITLHPAQGLFWQSPVLLLALVGGYFMFQHRDYRWEAIVVIIGFVAYLLITSGYYMWWGGWAFGPRNLIPMLPFLGLPLLFLPRRLYPLLAILTLVSVLQMYSVAASTIQVPDNVVSHMNRVGYFDYSSIYSYCLPRLIAGQFASNLGHKVMGLQNWFGFIPLLVVDGAMAGFFFFRRGNGQPAPGIDIPG